MAAVTGAPPLKDDCPEYHTTLIDLPCWEHQRHFMSSPRGPAALLTLLAQSNPVPMAARVFTMALLSLHFTA